MGRTIFRRNHLIADLFSRIHFGEKIGSGMKRMRDICKKENAPYPEIDYTDTHFYIVFKQSREYLKMSKKEEKVAGKTTQKITQEITQKSVEKVRSKCGESAELVFAVIKENKFIKTHEMVEKTGLSQRTVENAIAKLKKAKFLKREGSPKGGHWEVLSNDKNKK